MGRSSRRRKENAISRPREEVIQAFQEQKEALISSCAGYDKGQTWEAFRLATSIYVLTANKSGQNVSILEQLGKRASIDYISYSTPQWVGNLLSWTPLVLTRHSGGPPELLPVLNNVSDRRHAMKFKAWWKEAVFETPDKRTLSRMNLIHTMRNRDGGGHYDSVVPDGAYSDMKNEVMNFNSGDGRGNEWVAEISGIERASVRHIAFELLESMESIEL